MSWSGEPRVALALALFAGCGDGETVGTGGASAEAGAGAMASDGGSTDSGSAGGQGGATCPTPDTTLARLSVIDAYTGIPVGPGVAVRQSFCPLPSAQCVTGDAFVEECTIASRGGEPFYFVVEGPGLVATASVEFAVEPPAGPADQGVAVFPDVAGYLPERDPTRATVVVRMGGGHGTPYGCVGPWTVSLPGHPEAVAGYVNGPAIDPRLTNGTDAGIVVLSNITPGPSVLPTVSGCEASLGTVPLVAGLVSYANVISTGPW